MMHALAPSTPTDLRALLGEMGLEAESGLQGPDRTLERILDLPRCVALSAVLDRHPAATPTPPLDTDARDAALSRLRLRLLEADLVAKLASTRQQIARRFAGALSGLRPAPDAAAVHALLLEQDALAPEAGTRRRRLAQRLSDRYAAVIRGAQSIVLKETALLRQDLHDGLDDCGPRARQLAELDESFDGMFRVELTHAVMRLEGQLAARLEPKLLQALDALSPEGAVDDVQPMFAPDGCVGAFLRDGERLTLNLLELEWSPLMGLLQAVRTDLEQDAEHNAEHNAEQDAEQDAPAPCPEAHPDAHATGDDDGQLAHLQAHANGREGEVS
ncbi:MAG: hypothetical protein PVI30_03760 [Myxococcales bacterium]